MIYTLFKKMGIIGSMEISEQKVNSKLEELNIGQDSPPWIVVEGQNSLMSTDFQEGGAIFNMAKGVIVKLFLNTQTGELKMYPLTIFKQDN